MRTIEYLLVAYIILKPFYIWPSGRLQLADGCIIAAVALVVFLSVINRPVLERCYAVFRRHWLLWAFFAWTVVVNGVYSWLSGDLIFMTASVQYGFVVAGVVCFAIGLERPVFLRNIAWASMIALLVQAGIAVLGMGRMYDAVRYMGTFNDPNQFAFFVLLAYCMVWCFAWQQRRWKMLLVASLTALGLATMSVSIGMLVTMVSIIGVSWVVYIRQSVNTTRIWRRTAVMLGMVALAVIWIGALLLGTSRNLPILEFVQQRFDEKVSGASSAAQVSVWEDRGYDKLVLYPQYLLFGSGEGMMERFSEAHSAREIHATLPSLVFYYGLLPTLLITAWLIQRVMQMSAANKVIATVLLVESFTLLHQRQVLFWVLFLILPVLMQPRVGDGRSV